MGRMDELNEFLFSLLKSVTDRADPSGFLSFQADILVKNGMPIQNVPRYLQEQIEWFETHDEDKDDTPPMPRISMDSDELQRLMRSEMNGD